MLPQGGENDRGVPRVSLSYRLKLGGCPMLLFKAFLRVPILFVKAFLGVPVFSVKAFLSEKHTQGKIGGEFRKGTRLRYFSLQQRRDQLNCLDVLF